MTDAATTADALLSSDDAEVRYLAIVRLRGTPAHDPSADAARSAIPNGRFARALLDGQQPDGGFGVPSYQYWRGTHWRLLSLAAIGFPSGDERIAHAFEDEMRSVVGPFLRSVRLIDGRTHRHACVEGNALGAACRLGFASDERVVALAEGLIESQWPDGGWNNPQNKNARFSAVYETHEPLWGLTEYWLATGDRRAREAAERAAQCLLSRRLIYSFGTGRPVVGEWKLLHYPLYWWYDVLQGLSLLVPLGLVNDARAEEALDLVAAARNRRTGMWRHTGSPRWALPGERREAIDVIDWGRKGPNPFITIKARYVLAAAGRISLDPELHSLRT